MYRMGNMKQLATLLALTLFTLTAQAQKKVFVQGTAPAEVETICWEHGVEAQKLEE